MKAEKNTYMSPHTSQRRILTHTHRTMYLNRTIDNLQRDLGHLDLCLRNLSKSMLGILLVGFYRRVEDDETRGVDLDTRLGDPCDERFVLREGFAKGLLALVVEAVDHPFESLFSGAHGAHGVVDAAWAEATLHDLEAGEGVSLDA